MEYRRLGTSGLKLSALSYGSWVTFAGQLDEEKGRACMRLAYESGVNFFDNAEVYAAGESERLMGRILASEGWPRDSFCVSSKVFWGGDRPTQRGLHRKHVVEACHGALDRLQVDYLDLFFCHRPDLDTPIEETVRVMNDLIHQGKVLYWGTSEWSAQQLQEAWTHSDRLGLIGPTMEQPQYNLFERQKVESDYLPLFERGLGLTVWSPLASGILSGKYSEGVPGDSRMAQKRFAWLKERNLDSERGQEQVRMAGELAALAAETEMTPAQMALAWCLQNPQVSTVILGASRVSQLAENLAALEHMESMSPELLRRMEAIVGSKPEAPQRF